MAGEGFIFLTCVTVMSVNTDCAVDGERDSCCGCFNFEDKEFSVKRGDYAPLMEKVSHYLQQAQVNLWFKGLIAQFIDAAGQLAFRLREHMLSEYFFNFYVAKWNLAM